MAAPTLTNAPSQEEWRITPPTCQNDSIDRESLAHLSAYLGFSSCSRFSEHARDQRINQIKRVQEAGKLSCLMPWMWSLRIKAARRLHHRGTCTPQSYLLAATNAIECKNCERNKRSPDAPCVASMPTDKAESRRLVKPFAPSCATKARASHS